MAGAVSAAAICLSVLTVTSAGAATVVFSTPARLDVPVALSPQPVATKPPSVAVPLFCDRYLLPEVEPQRGTRGQCASECEIDVTQQLSDRFRVRRKSASTTVIDPGSVMKVAEALTVDHGRFAASAKRKRAEAVDLPWPLVHVDEKPEIHMTHFRNAAKVSAFDLFHFFIAGPPPAPKRVSY